MTRRLEPPTTWADIVGALVVAGGGVLAVVRFLGEDPLARNPESFAASVALGALIAVPGVLCLLAGRTGRTPLLLPAAILLAMLSTLSPATLPLVVAAVALAWQWVRSTPGASRLRSTVATVVVIIGSIGATLLLLLATTTLTIVTRDLTYETDGWTPWSTSMLVLALLAGTVAAACAILPGVRPGRDRGRASVRTS